MAIDYAAMRAAAEARKTLAARLRLLATAEPALAPERTLMLEAAEAIDYLQAQVDQQRRDAIEEQRDANRAIRDAVAEDRWRGSQGDEYGSY